VAKRGALLLRGLKKLARKYPAAIKEVRGLGFMLGVELAGPAGPVVKGLRERGVLATKAGDNVLRLLPPLVVKPAEIRALLEALDAVLANG
jgi:acetylornithine/N-succinyldiaminopimelate aminotransferase